MPHFIIFEISTALNNDFQADCSDVFRFLIGLSIPKLRGVLCFVFVWGIMGKCELFLFMLKIILLRHKVGLCLHGHIYAEYMTLRYQNGYAYKPQYLKLEYLENAYPSAHTCLIIHVTRK